MERVHNPAIVLSHYLLLGLRHDESLEQGRYTYTVLCEGSKNDWAIKTYLRQLIRAVLSLSIFSAIGHLLHTPIVRSPGIRAGTPSQDREGVPRELNLSSAAQDSIYVAVRKLRPQKDRTCKVVHRI